MIQTFKQFLKDQDELERRRTRVQREKALFKQAEAEANASILKRLNTKPDKLSWCPDL